MYDEYVALNQDTLDRIEIVPMTVHLVVRNNNRLLVTMYTDVEQFLLYQTKTRRMNLFKTLLTTIRLNSSMVSKVSKQVFRITFSHDK